MILDFDLRGLDDGRKERHHEEHSDMGKNPTKGERHRKEEEHSLRVFERACGVFFRRVSGRAPKRRET